MKIRQAMQLIGMLEQGDFAAELDQELDRVVQGVRDAAGPKKSAKGSLTLKLDIEVQGVTLTVTGEVAGKTPKLARGSSMYFVNALGEITTDHPQQIDMFPRDSAERRADLSGA